MGNLHLETKWVYRWRMEHCRQSDDKFTAL